MPIAEHSHWRSGARGANGSALAFDTPGCLFRYRLGGRGTTTNEWVIEYYGPADRQTDAHLVRYVIGSDVIGPMGPDLVPVDPTKVETFRTDHHARAAVAFDEITSALLTEL